MPEELDKFAWPGGYTILYIFSQSNEELVLCGNCANEAAKGIEMKDSKYEDYKRVSSFIHWEGISLWCDDCGTELESEYGDPDEEEPRELPPTIVIDNHEPVDVLQYEREVKEGKAPSDMEAQLRSYEGY